MTKPVNEEIALAEAGLCHAQCAAPSDLLEEIDLYIRSAAKYERGDADFAKNPPAGFLKKVRAALAACSAPSGQMSAGTPEALERIDVRLADLREANEIFRKSTWDRGGDIQRNDREIRWLIDTRFILASPRSPGGTDWKLVANYETDVAQAAVEEIERLRAQVEEAAGIIEGLLGLELGSGQRGVDFLEKRASSAHPSTEGA